MDIRLDISTDAKLDMWLDFASEAKIIKALKIYRKHYHEALEILKKKEQDDLDKSIFNITDYEEEENEVDEPDELSGSPSPQPIDL